MSRSPPTSSCGVTKLAFASVGARAVMRCSWFLPAAPIWCRHREGRERREELDIVTDLSGHRLTTDPQTRAEYAEAQRLAAELARQRYQSWSASDREDLVGEVMVKYFRKFGRGRAPQNPRGWLACVLRTSAIDLHRARPDELPVDPQPAGSEVLGESELEHLLGAGRQTPSLLALSGQLVEDVLGLVPEERAELLRSKYLHGHTATEIAARTGRSTDAVNQAVSRAKRALQAALAAGPGSGRGAAGRVPSALLNANDLA